MNRVKIVSVSKEKYIDDTLIGNSYFGCHDQYNQVLDLKQIYNKDNQSLAKLYNQQIEQSKNYEYLVFCHDDVSLECANLPDKLELAIGDESNYAICGVAGTKKCKIQDKNLWHLMGEKKDLSGAVAHYVNKDSPEAFMTPFGSFPQRVILLDGVFLAVNLKKINEVGLRFDEKNPAKFHFYDLDFCLQANKLGLKMITWPIWLIHNSHGLTDINHKEWNIGNEYFKNKWRK